MTRRDCGVCGVPADAEVNVTVDGYTVPRCRAHMEARAYQAESRLESLIERIETATDEARSFHANRELERTTE